MPHGFFIGKNDKFRNQRISVVFEIPVGKGIRFDHSISNYNWFSVHNNNGNYYYDDDDDWDDWDYTYRPEPGREYIMNPDGRPEKITSF